MAQASYAVSSFLGGELSDFAQGRFDKPDYRISLNICLNAFPVEIGPWTRRPGTAYGGHSRLGAPARALEFDFEQDAPATCEFSDGFLRFRNGTVLITTNDAQSVVSVSSANPAVVRVASAVTWATGDTVIFPGASTPLLENRQFTITSIDSTHFSLADALTGATIDGSTLGALTAGTTVEHVHELATVYVSQAWKNLRSVQAETTMVLLCPSYPPQVLTVSTEPSGNTQAQFTIAPVTFNDGPYLDPPTNGVLITPSAVSGLVTLTLSFNAYNSAQAYAKGSFVTSSGVDYISLIDQNVGNTPASSPSAWAPTSASTAINNGQGFLGTDVGRLIRLFSEPPAFVATTTYTAGQVVSYNPTNEPGAATYWQALTTTTTTPPGYDLSHWQLLATGPATWTWGKITSLSNIISRNLAGSGSIGDMTLFNGINAPFDGNFSKSISSSAGKSVSGSGFFIAGTQESIAGYVGKNYSGAGAQKIAQATIYPSNDRGFGFGTYQDTGGVQQAFFCSYTLNLRASLTPPASSSNGTQLGTVSFSGSSAPVTIVSADQNTAWNYVWLELIMTVSFATTGTSFSIDIDVAQISFFSPTTSTSSSAGCVAEILGPAIAYSGVPIATWRLGAYSNTTGWPTCGCYDGGRLWLGGAISNRFDASGSNAIVPGSALIDFSPTNQYGVVAASNAISETINADSTNPLFWMVPDLQGILIGTQAGEFLILAPTSGPIAPNNIDSRRATRIGGSKIEPRRTEHTLIFIKRFGRKIMEYFADVFSGKFSAPNLADKAQHITRAGVAELAYTDATTPVLWGRDTIGAFFGVTYKRDTLSTSQGPTFAAFHRHSLGSGRIVESICSGPSVGGNLDSLTLVTNDTSSSIRHIEVLTDAPDEDTALSAAWFLDDAVNPTSMSASDTPAGGAPFGGVTFNGLWHLNGKTVQVFAGGCDCGDRGDLNVITDFTVTNGSCFVPFGDGISAGPGQGQFTHTFLSSLSLSQIVIGFTYNSDGQLVRPIAPAEAGTRAGPGFGKVSRTHFFAAQLVNVLGISFGTSFGALKPANFTQADEKTPVAPLTMFSGMYTDQVDDDYSRFDNRLCWRVSRPYPATVVAIGPSLETEDQ